MRMVYGDALSLVDRGGIAVINLSIVFQIKGDVSAIIQMQRYMG